MLSTTLVKLLNAQIATEWHAMAAYRQLASTLRRLGMTASAEWFRASSKEEREHGDSIAEYLEHRGAPVEIPAIEPPQPAANPRAIAEMVMALEESVTAKLSAIRKAAVDEGDALTFEFISPMLAEQIHGEDDARLFKAIVESGSDMMTVDQQVGQTFGGK